MKDHRPLAIFGDWHGDVGFGLDAIRSAAAAGVGTMLHVGDFGLDWPGALRGRYTTFSLRCRRETTTTGTPSWRFQLEATG